jgi:hypothetical protein
MGLNNAGNDYDVLDSYSMLIQGIETQSFMLSSDAKAHTVTLTPASCAAPNTRMRATKPLSTATAIRHYTLTNLRTGRTVAHGQVPTTGCTLNFMKLPSDIYVLSITSGKDKPQTYKLSFR